MNTAYPVAGGILSVDSVSPASFHHLQIYVYYVHYDVLFRHWQFITELNVKAVIYVVYREGLFVDVC